MGEVVNLPRGIRNNNPGNIRKTVTHWQGEIDSSFEKSFEVFEKPEDGLRALMKVLLKYFRKDGLDTVEGIISRWAPPNENATERYIEAVAHRLGVDGRERIDVTVPKILIGLAQAIVMHENGHAPKTRAEAWYSDDLYQRAFNRALSVIT